MAADASREACMKIRLYLDEDTMDDLVDALRSRSIDVLTVGEAQRKKYSDEQQLRFATEQGRAIYSFNRKHYMVLHTRFLAQGISHAGIILEIHNRWSVGEQMRRLVKLVDTLSAEEMVNRVEFLSSWG
jgi:hypothetical protein